MYIPSSFAETDLGKLHEFIERHSFATLITVGESGTVASHLPLLLDRDSGPQGKLIGHMARANTQWKGADSVGGLRHLPWSARVYLAKLVRRAKCRAHVELCRSSRLWHIANRHGPMRCCCKRFETRFLSTNPARQNHGRSRNRKVSFSTSCSTRLSVSRSISTAWRASGS